MKNPVFLTIFLAFFIFSAQFSLADFQLNPNEVQLSVGSYLLDIEETAGIVDNIDFNGGSFTITVSSSQQIKIGSLDRVKFDFEPQSAGIYITRTCEPTKSTIKIETPAIAPLAITITPNGTCVPGDGGGGGAGLGIISPIIPPPPQPPQPTGVPAGEIPPSEFPLGLPLGPISAPPTLPPVIPPVTPPTEPGITPPIVSLPEPIKETIETITEIGKGIIEAVQSISTGDLSIVRDIISGLRANTTVTNNIQNVIQPALTFFAIVSAIIAALTAIQASATVAAALNIVVETFSFAKFYLLGLIHFKRRVPWGRVIEKTTGRPVPGAVVQVWDAEFKKLKDTQLTDKDGRFGALVGAGKYYIKVAKDGFQDKQTETIEVASANQILNIEVPIILIQEISGLEQIKKANLFSIVKNFLDSINPVLLVLGTLMSLITLIILPTTLNYVIFTIYVAFDILKLYFTYHFIKPFGKVLDFASALPLSLAIIRVFDEEKNLLLQTKASDDEGRFNFLLAPGKYFLTCVKAGYQAYRSAPIIFTKASLATMDVKLQKKQLENSPNF
ncbi:MAG: carboxypeptidase-like regulatory domain-containing protein [bacterium]|nr:carboxypeptidase-like regulatory domain-containing protein [bacterium]